MYKKVHISGLFEPPAKPIPFHFGSGYFVPIPFITTFAPSEQNRPYHGQKKPIQPRPHRTAPA
jgi:hypothetical protein